VSSWVGEWAFANRILKTQEDAPGGFPQIVTGESRLVLGREVAGERRRQVEIEQLAMDLFKFEPGTRLGVWPELKIKVTDHEGTDPKRFDYTFDYLLMPLGRLRLDDEPGLNWHQANLWERAGYRLEGDVVLDAPVGRPAVIEIMTSSTSGGNKRKGTTIPDAFRRAIVDGSGTEAPGINYRQVWARMASQLFVKSEVAAAWGGTALWVIQDVLAKYISDTTALDLASLRAEELSEINILSLSYGDDTGGEAGVIELPSYELYAGEIGRERNGKGDNGFLDIVRLGFKPRRSDLIAALLRRPPVNEILVP
jgi:hypothetical protein